MGQASAAGSYQEVARLMHALAHPVRLQILEVLLKGPACVSDLIEVTGRRQAYISQHLAILREAGLVVSTRTDTHRCYRLAQPALREVIQLAGAVCPQKIGIRN